MNVSYRNQPGEDYFESGPRIAVEIVSDSNSTAEMELKVNEYLASGTAEVWLLYPRSPRAWIYRGTRNIAEPQDHLSSPLLPGFRIGMRELLSR